MNALRLFGSPMRQDPTRIELAFARADRAEVALFDAAGRRVRRLADREFAAGTHTLTWDGRDDGGRALARGVYFVRVNYARSGFEKSGKLVVLR